VSLVKTVELRILADAADAQRQMDEVAGKADKLQANTIRMRFKLDSAEGRAQLDAIKAKADEMGFKDVSIKVRVDGAGRAIADLMAVKHEEDKVRDQGLMNRIGGLIGGAGGGIPGSLGPVPLPALAAAVPIVGALATEAAGLAAGFAAAGAGAGAFALLAMPAVKQVEAAYQGLNTAQQKYQAAQAKFAEAPTKANATALKAAALNLDLAKDAIGKLPASEQAAIKGIQGLSGEFGKMSKAFQPVAFKVFADGLKVVGNLLPHLTQFATPFAASLDKAFQQLGKFTASKGFSDFMSKMAADVGPATTAILNGIGKVGGAIGHLLTIMSSKDIAHSINIAFGAIAGTINVVASGIHRFMQNFDGMKAAATSAGHAIASAFKSVVSGAVSFQEGVDRAFMAVVRGAGNMVSGVVHFVSSLPGKIKGFFAGAAGWLVSAGKNIIQGLINGIESMVSAVGSAIGRIASTIRSFLPFSPAKQGPLSGQGSPDIAGRRIAVMLAGGMDSGARGVALAAGRLAGAAGISPAAAAAGHGGEVHLHVHYHGVHTGDKYANAQQVHQLMRDYKRNRGGAPLGLG